MNDELPMSYVSTEIGLRLDSLFASVLLRPLAHMPLGDDPHPVGVRHRRSDPCEAHRITNLFARGPYKMRVEKHGWERGYPARSLVVIGGGGPRVPAPERRLAGGPDGVRTCAPGGGTRLGLTV